MKKFTSFFALGFEDMANKKKTKQDYSHSWMNPEKKKKHQKLKLKYFAFHIFDLEIQPSHTQL